jgi:tetratricopeptide (TPR) repeat protein
MPTPVINTRWRWLIFAAMAFASGTLAFSAARHELAAHWAASSDPEMWLRAAVSEPLNAALWYRLARYRQLDFQHSDLPLAISYYQRATHIDPGSSVYWMDLAGAYETSGGVSQAEQAFREARRLYPISAEPAWRFGNLLLRRGRVPEAFQQIHDAVLSDPKLTALAVSLCWQSSRDIDQILKTVLPDRWDENWGATQFFVQAREPLPAMAVWNRIAAHHSSFPITNAFSLLDMLIETGHANDAQAVWKQALLAAGIPTKADSNSSLVWNGGFEQEILNGGFDWRVAPITGVVMGWDEQIVHSGGRSLRLDFDGTTNVDFQNVWQYVPVQSATRYRFRASFRTLGLTTDSGIRFEVRDVTRPGSAIHFTPNFVGSREWVEADAEFLTSADTKLLQLVLRRNRSDKLASKIKGTAWVDDVALVPVPSMATAPR